MTEPGTILGRMSDGRELVFDGYRENDRAPLAHIRMAGKDHPTIVLASLLAYTPPRWEMTEAGKQFR